jgi:hypothetical protein
MSAYGVSAQGLAELAQLVERSAELARAISGAHPDGVVLLAPLDLQRLADLHNQLSDSLDSIRHLAGGAGVPSVLMAKSPAQRVASIGNW